MTDQAQRGDRRDDRRHGARSAPVTRGMQGLHLRVAVIPAAVMGVLGIGTVVFLLVSDRSVMTTRIVLVAAAALMVLTLIAAASGAASATRRLQRQVSGLRSASSRAQDDLRLLAERAQRGEQPSLPPPPVPSEDSDSFALLANDLQRERHSAQQVVVHTGGQAAGSGPDQRVEVFVNLARRMQSLVHREIQLLDDLEGQVEDPVLLKGLFTVDHLATRMRRQSESLAVLGGAVSRRQWSRPVTMHEVLRAAVAEVEQYSRVKVVPPVEGTLLGNAVTDVIHLVAELIENATKFSAPHTQAMLRAQSVTAGLVIEVEDRGLGMLAADQQRMNGLLADPARVNIGELLRDGRIGLFVVSTLARRHGIRVQLQSNIYGGTQAVVVLPKNLIEPARPREPQAAGAAAPALPAQQQNAQYQDAQHREAQHREAQHREPQHREPPPVPAATGPVASAPAAPAAPGTLPVRQAPGATAAPGNTRWSGMAAEGRYAPAGRPAGPAGSPLTDPIGAPVPPPGAPAAAAPLPPAAAPSAMTQPRPAPRPSGPPTGERPALPRRHGQMHMAPELREARAPRRDDPADDQIPGLMAAFQRGISRAAEEDSPARTDSPR